jgi:glycosyltransferase involved in cell wall biosynthesis
LPPQASEKGRAHLSAIRRVFYASAGGADIIASHNAWREGRDNPSEVSITFSSQIEEFCQKIGAKALLISDRTDGAVLEDGDFRLEHRGKRSRRGILYFWEELRYCLMLLRAARSFRADLALIDSGVTQFFLLKLFPLFGIPVVPILHNCLWARGFRPDGRGQKLIQWLDARFWRGAPRATIAVSPEAERQVEELAGPHHPPITQIRAQFRRAFFVDIPPPDADKNPFEVMFIGRVVKAKGVLDLPRMARFIEDCSPGLVRWTICGRGDALEPLRTLVAELDVEQVVDVPGWVSREMLQQLYARSHCWIIPTRSGFAEGLAMTAAESIMAGRPIVSNPIVPALEILAPAAVGARSNDWQSHAEAVLTLAEDRELYRRLQTACAPLAEQFFDRDRGLTAVLMRTWGGIRGERSGDQNCDPQGLSYSDGPAA